MYKKYFLSDVRCWTEFEFGAEARPWSEGGDMIESMIARSVNVDLSV